MPFAVMFLILFSCFIKENDKLSDKTRTTSVGVIVVIVVFYILFGVIL